MDPTPLLASIQQSGFAVWIRDSLYAFPFLEAAHVFGFAIVVGTIAIIDLRLLGLASVLRPVDRVMGDVLRWALLAFVLTAVTGALMFLANPVVYFQNTYFRVKVLLLVLAGLNAFAFELTARKTMGQWNTSAAAPTAGRIVAVVSLVVWVAVIFTGRMIGFTATRTSLNEPPPAELNLEDIFGAPETPPPDGK